MKSEKSPLIMGGWMGQDISPVQIFVRMFGTKFLENTGNP